MPALEGLAAAAEEEQRPTALNASHGVTVTPQIMRPPNAVSNVAELQRRIAPRRAEPGWRAAVLDERADTLFVCERVRKAAATERQPQRAERAM
jgi:hypothetical protein